MCTEADIEAHLEYKVKQKRELTTEKRKVSGHCLSLPDAAMYLMFNHFKKDLEMLQNYKPWGKPAAGAPRVSCTAKILIV